MSLYIHVTMLTMAVSNLKLVGQSDENSNPRPKEHDKDNDLTGMMVQSIVKKDSSGLYSFDTEKLELGRIKRSKTPLLVAVAAIFRDGQLETNSGVHCLKRIFSWSLLPIPPALLPQANEL